MNKNGSNEYVNKKIKKKIEECKPTPNKPKCLVLTICPNSPNNI